MSFTQRTYGVNMPAEIAFILFARRNLSAKPSVVGETHRTYTLIRYEKRQITLHERVARFVSMLKPVKINHFRFSPKKLDSDIDNLVVSPKGYFSKKLTELLYSYAN
jgi:hypothetical protein